MPGQFDKFITEALETLNAESYYSNPTVDSTAPSVTPNIHDVEQNTNTHFGILNKIAQGTQNLNDPKDQKALEDAMHVGAIKAEQVGDKVHYSITEPYVKYMQTMSQKIGSNLNGSKPPTSTSTVSNTIAPPLT